MFFFSGGGLDNCKYISVQNASEKVNEVECGELTARLISVAVLSFVICDAPDGKLFLAGLDAVERDRALLPIFFCMETCTRTGINVSSISIVAAMQCY